MRLFSDASKQDFAHIFEVGFARAVDVARVELLLTDQIFGFEELAVEIVLQVAVIHTMIIPRQPRMLKSPRDRSTQRVQRG